MTAAAFSSSSSTATTTTTSTSTSTPAAINSSHTSHDGSNKRRRRVRLRFADAATDDPVAIADIYAHYVRTSPATFELEPPDAATIAARIAASHFWLVAEEEQEEEEEGRDAHPHDHDRAARAARTTTTRTVIGYGCISRHKERPCYRFSVDTTAYVAATHVGQAHGLRLTAALLDLAHLCGYAMVYAGATANNEASVRMHEKLGFKQIARFSDAGYKFGKWWDVVWLQRRAAGASGVAVVGQSTLSYAPPPLPDVPAEPLHIRDVPRDAVDAVLAKYSL